MSHLGERVSALIDGELGHTERERVLAHLTLCADCRAEVDAFRALKNRLRSMSPPAMPADLTMSLLRMSEPGGPLPPRIRPFPDHPAFAARGLPALHDVAPLRPRTPRFRSLRGRRMGYVAVGVASAAAAIGTMLMVSETGTRPNPAPAEMFVHPSVRSHTTFTPGMMSPSPRASSPFSP